MIKEAIFMYLPNHKITKKEYIYPTTIYFVCVCVCVCSCVCVVRVRVCIHVCQISLKPPLALFKELNLHFMNPGLQC